MLSKTYNYYKTQAKYIKAIASLMLFIAYIQISSLFANYTLSTFPCVGKALQSESFREQWQGYTRTFSTLMIIIQ